MPAKFEVAKNASGEFIFRLKASNGEIILRSEGYATKSGAQNGIKSVRKNAPSADRYQKLTAKNGQFYFNLTSSNHHVIGTSEMYVTERSRDQGMASVKTSAANAPIVQAEAAG
jgi:uncharacterized protein